KPAANGRVGGCWITVAFRMRWKRHGYASTSAGYYTFRYLHHQCGRRQSKRRHARHDDDHARRAVRDLQQNESAPRQAGTRSLLSTSTYLTPNWKSICDPSARLMRNTYVFPAVRPRVSRLKIHCWLVASQRNAVSGVRESAGRSTEVDVVPWITAMIR